jgi:hypothetical protein
MTIKAQNSDVCQSELSLFDIFPDWQERSSTPGFEDFNLSFSVEKITPYTASQILKTQKLNRKVAQSRVLEYARRMEQSEWTVSDAIKFDETGSLIDGQHLLMAVCRSGVEFWFPLIVGYPAYSQHVMDLGLNRTVAQIGQLQGLETTTHNVSIVRALFLPTAGYTSAGSMLSSPQKVLNLLIQHKEAIDFSAKTYGSRPVKFAPVRAIVARAWYYENRKRLEEFLEVFDTGFGQGPQDNAAIALRTVVDDMRKAKAIGGSSDRRVLSFKTVSALEAFLSNEERKILREKTTLKWKIAGVDA